MKIIDWETKGNVIRFYLGDDDCEDYWGDNWDDAPYEHNAGPVYSEFVKGHHDVIVPFDSGVYEPSWGFSNSHFSKEDMKKHAIPCIVVVKDSDVPDVGWLDFTIIIAVGNSTKYYLGDHMTPD